jgi:hypothetical protein
MNDTRQECARHKGLVAGLILILVGGAMLAAQLNYLSWSDLGLWWWRWWPLVFIALALARIADPKERRDVGGIIMLLGMSAWAFASSFEWFGLNWATSWPLLIVLGGLQMMRRPRRERSQVEVSGGSDAR